ncbi:hypothetical protein ACFX2I_042970 [Malus domestica]|uniref:Uncharacterized protein n=1 Tax=Malus domestica TaxID=3750 RepID=A0A498J6S2_MALDO|nr:hypothetical protein DVH24_020492 [Malus domestica]
MDWFHKAKLIENGKCLFLYNAILDALIRADRLSLAKEIHDHLVKEASGEAGCFYLYDNDQRVLQNG